MSVTRIGTAALTLTAAWLLAYGPTLSGGFIKDDFAWIYHGRLQDWSSLYAMFTTADGFYRPIVELSFGATEALFGTNPIPYALTNLMLGLACAVAVYALSRALGLTSAAALVAAAVWAFNFHGINMAIVWLSGRTSLLGTLFATLSALALTGNRGMAAGLLAFAALMSKEEVLALPFILTAWLVIDKRRVSVAAGTWIALGVYLVLRDQSGAFGVSDAPPYYQFTLDPRHVWTNIVEYADRSMTLGVLIAVAAAIALGRLPALDGDDRRLLLKGAVWLIGGFALTLWLPVRSSLYAVLPSVGAGLATGALVAATAKHASPVRTLRVATAALLLPFVLLPVYWSRNVRWTELRNLSNATFRAIRADPLPSRTLVVLEDDLSTRANFRHAFGSLFPEAAKLYFGNHLSLWIEPPPPEVDRRFKPSDATRIVTFRLVGGRVESGGTTTAALISRTPVR